MVIQKAMNINIKLNLKYSFKANQVVYEVNINDKSINKFIKRAILLSI